MLSCFEYLIRYLTVRKTFVVVPQKRTTELSVRPKQSETKEQKCRIETSEIEIIATSNNGTFTGSNDTEWNDDEEEIVLSP